jgi:hypothetical protein
MTAGTSGRVVSKVAVLMGGLSAEREVSLSSGRECAKALREAGYQVIEVDCGPDLALRLSEINPDVAFNARHGRWGEVRFQYRQEVGIRPGFGIAAGSVLVWMSAHS